MDHNYVQWRWNPMTASIVDKKWMKDTVSTVELKIPQIWSTEIAQENFLDTPDILKQMETLASGAAEADNWMEPVPLDIP
ncbi:hypothetical protein TRFO_40516 [Tritrichomonas foetus]|uniref:Uncharacterized protein n=1 Tax=Tritrichomonas foetus TaxID=1144522 RepID=A0A1J4J386_9EUKA|nr:hypothetical protein TRFO_40516 [Tritrichomonas foetus]|eukprot:OHS93209.1 hypothetical protein TRFO_40516 [Tritrichomonas foetus]